MARRYAALHHNLQEGDNVVFHREHRSPRNRSGLKVGRLQQFDRSERRKWKNRIGSNAFQASVNQMARKKKRY